MQHRGRLRQLHEERGLPRHDLVLGPHPHEDGVGGVQPERGRGHAGANLCQHGGQAGLSQQRALAAHVGAGDEEEGGEGAAKADGVGDERALPAREAWVQFLGVQGFSE